MGLEQTFKIQQLEEEKMTLYHAATMRLNALIDVQVFLQEDNPDGALMYLDEILNNERN